MSALKRFYQQASAVPVAGGFGIMLDARALKTPARAAFIVPTQSLAAAVAAEWNAQGDAVEIKAMRLTGLANAAIDRIAPERAAFAARLADYGAHDLLCYRAEAPVALISRQAKAWQVWLDWLAATHGAHLAIGEGVMHVTQSAGALAALGRATAQLDAFRLAGAHIVTTATGSLTLGLAVTAGALDARAALALSRIDEEFQAEQWGRDAEAEARAEAIRTEVEDAGRFLKALAG